MQGVGPPNARKVLRTALVCELLERHIFMFINSARAKQQYRSAGDVLSLTLQSVLTWTKAWSRSLDSFEVVENIGSNSAIVVMILQLARSLLL